MSSTPPTAAPQLPFATARMSWRRIRESILHSPASVLGTVLVVWLILMAAPALLNWLLLKASFTAPDARTCREASGACWSFIREKYRLILFGTYPFDQQWRPLLATLLLIGSIVVTGVQRLRGRGLIVWWALALATVAWLMWGGLFGLTFVENVRWGGLPLTLMLSVFGIAFAFPFGVCLALGRRSRMPAIKAICVGYIEFIRGVPLISLLFMSSVMLPLFLPEGFSIDKLLRAQIAIIMFAAAYIAEIVRGGLQSIPKGQYEGADSIGLSYWQQMRKVIVPQALKVVIPPLVSTIIALFKDTSLVVIIGIFDLTQSAKAALADPAWSGFGVEAYLFIGLIYFAFCYCISKYSSTLERSLAREQQASPGR